MGGEVGDLYSDTTTLKQAARARAAATRELLTRHAEEFAALMETERVARGLPPQNAKSELASLRRRVAELQEQLDATQVEAHA